MKETYKYPNYTHQQLKTVLMYTDPIGVQVKGPSFYSWLTKDIGLLASFFGKAISCVKWSPTNVRLVTMDLLLNYFFDGSFFSNGLCYNFILTCVMSPIWFIYLLQGVSCCVSKLGWVRVDSDEAMTELLWWWPSQVPVKGLKTLNPNLSLSLLLWELRRSENHRKKYTLWLSQSPKVREMDYAKNWKFQGRKMVSPGRKGPDSTLPV